MEYGQSQIQTAGAEGECDAKCASHKSWHVHASEFVVWLQSVPALCVSTKARPVHQRSS